MKGRCKYLDYETNECHCNNLEQCKGKEVCDEFEEEEG